MATFLLHRGVMGSTVVLWHLIATLIIALACFMVSFRAFRTYRGVIRFSSFSDLLRIAGAIIFGMTIFYIASLSLSHVSWFIRFTAVELILLSLISIALMWVERLLVKMLYENMNRGGDTTSVFIFGIKEGGVAIAKSINSTVDSPFRVTGFVTVDNEMTDHYLLGQPVYNFDLDLVDIMKEKRVSRLLVSPLMMTALRENGEIVDAMADAGVRILVRPQAREWDGKSELRVSDLAPVDVEDLLPRDKIEIDMEAAARLITDRVVMITGAAGSIGSEMVRQIASYRPRHLLLVDQAETPMHDVRLMMRREWPDIQVDTIVGNIADAGFMERLFRQARPEYVFHAAAYKHVPMMEDNPYQSVINNILGTKVIADLAVKYGTKKFVMVSTDKAVNPTNVMGCSKRICEIYVQSLDRMLKENPEAGSTQFVTTRFGNVLGSNGSVIPIFQEQIRRHQPITVTHPDIIRYFMLIPEACKLVIEAGTMGNGGEIYVFDMGEPVKIADLARRMIRLSGARDIEIVFTGLRDGEKLYEEVLNDQEQTLPTFHPKIKVAKVREYQYEEVRQVIDDLVNTAITQGDMETVGAMKQIVPEFKSKHSKYEALDS